MAAKLHFKYGAMNAGKSTVLLMIAHDYEKNQRKKVLVVKPQNDTKGKSCVVSRLDSGEMRREVDTYIRKDADFYEEIKLMEQKPDVILIDESQFMTKENVWQLVNIVTQLDIPVLAFGLRSDFAGHPFEGSTWLFALAQDIEEIGVRTICHCGSRATMNLRLINGKPVFEGEQVSIDGENSVTYETRCLRDYLKLKTGVN